MHKIPRNDHASRKRCESGTEIADVITNEIINTNMGGNAKTNATTGGSAEQDPKLDQQPAPVGDTATSNPHEGYHHKG